MANVDNPRGLWPLYHAGGGVVRTNTYIVTTGQTIYQGDPVIAVTGGTVSLSSDDSGILSIGVAANRSTAGSAAGETIEVYDDPMIVFGIQSITGQTPAATEIFAAANPDVTAPSLGDISATELLAASAQAATFKVLGLVPIVNNVWGEHADLMVMFNEHFFGGSGIANNGI